MIIKSKKIYLFFKYLSRPNLLTRSEINSKISNFNTKISFNTNFLNPYPLNKSNQILNPFVNETLSYLFYKLFQNPYSV
ncbi:hypothetical protein LEP1GSC035_0334 [Leptospira noguchii str. 2007001578]|uniref:Uncharacterized protein n=2 Tax=Leptospira noguchii TaxID=28182 RepID=M6YVY9_9LEPT|nr:hypothetical protein LEP1GSC035_0334 [Leptospira noguchii str. 2007001578]EMO90518.1 hypothetical protein LEP1GSC024_1846 [Leptospira noguchii str. 2001034031]